MIIAAICLSAFMVWASADVGSNIYLKTLCRGSKEKRSVCLTFDDGPHEEMTPRVLDALKEHGVQATFFLIGRNAEHHPDIVRRMVAEGHTIANHTYSHAGLFPLSSASSVEREVTRCSETITSLTNKQLKLFRMPFGVTNPIIGKVIRHLGLKAIGWSIRSLDTIERRSREQICKRVIKRLHSGAIILLHDRCAYSDELLRQLIPAIKERGYSFISLEEMLNIDAYEA